MPKSKVPVRSQTAVRQTRVAQSPVAAYIRGENQPPATAGALGTQYYSNVMIWNLAVRTTGWWEAAAEMSWYFGGLTSLFVHLIQ